MSTTLFLRIASVIALLFAAGHTLGGTRSWSPQGETEVLQAMRSVRFETEGVTRTYLDFYLGFGHTISIYLFLQAMLLWQLAAIAKSDPPRARPMIASFFLASVTTAFVSWKFIFALPALFAVVLAAALGVAFVLSRRGSAG
jgi:hypothetical protein